MGSPCLRDLERLATKIRLGLVEQVLISSSRMTAPHKLDTAAMTLSFDARRAGYTEAMTPSTAMITARTMRDWMGITDTVTP